MIMAGLLGQLRLFGFSYQKSWRQTGFVSVSCLLPTPPEIPLALIFKTYPENCLFSSCPPQLWLVQVATISHLDYDHSLLPNVSVFSFALIEYISSVRWNGSQTIVTHMMKTLPCISISLSLKVLVPKMTYKTLPPVTLLLLCPGLPCSRLCPLRSSTGPSLLLL